MSIAKYKQLKLFKIILYILETIMLAGLAYLIYRAFAIGNVFSILVSGVVIVVVVLVLLIKREYALAEYRQKIAFQNIVHDLKTPLHSMLGFIELSQLKLKNIQENQNNDINQNEAMLQGISKNLDIIAKEGTRLIRLTNGFLNLSQLNIEKDLIVKKNFKVSEVMDDIMPLLESLCTQKNLSYKVEVTDESALIYGDKEKLIQVIYNLISNAVKYTDSGHVNCGSYKQDSNMIFYIEDTGCGLSKENNRVFQRYYSSDCGHRMEGNGIGLAICKDIVNMHGGQIWFDSKLGTGATFYFSVPIE